MNWNNKPDPKVTFLQEKCLFHFTETRILQTLLWDIGREKALLVLGLKIMWKFVNNYPSYLLTTDKLTKNTFMDIGIWNGNVM